MMTRIAKCGELEGSRAKRDYIEKAEGLGKVKGTGKGQRAQPFYQRPGRPLAAGIVDTSRSKAKELFRVLNLRRRLEEEVARPELQPKSEGRTAGRAGGGGESHTPRRWGG